MVILAFIIVYRTWYSNDYFYFCNTTYSIWCVHYSHATQSSSRIPFTSFHSLAADFEITPSPLNATVEQQIVYFNCQHRSSDDITWRVNRTTPNSPNISIEKVTLSGGGLRSSLSISTLAGYNGTMIECVAIFYRGSSPIQFTPPVTLLIQGLIMIMAHVHICNIIYAS